MRADLLPRPRHRILYLLYAPLQAVLRLVQVIWTLLFRIPYADVLLIQTPPAIPTLAAAWLVHVVRGSAIVVDWHNLGFSVLQFGGRGAKHPLVWIARAYERFFSRLAYQGFPLSRGLPAHLCVTQAMSAWLAREWGVRASVLHDRPPEFFRALNADERHSLYRRLEKQLVRDARGERLWSAGEDPWGAGCTPWTVVGDDGHARIREHAPRILVSSTSWSADEDFGMMLEALTQLDEELDKQVVDHTPTSAAPTSAAPTAAAPTAAAPTAAAPRRLRVLAIVTGKGPLRKHYEARMREMPLRHVAVLTMWLEPEDYPALLGSSDLGVCLHTSTAGIDLPMKVLDMFGCGLPVCARGFACLPELLEDRANGRVFDSSHQLAAQLLELLAPTPEAAHALQTLRDGVAASEAQQPRWAQNWQRAAAPLVLGTLQSRKRVVSTSTQRLVWALVAIGCMGVAVSVCGISQYGPYTL